MIPPGCRDPDAFIICLTASGLTITETGSHGGKMLVGAWLACWLANCRERPPEG